MRQYQIVSVDGVSAKKGWEEINCDYIEISGTLVKSFKVEEGELNEWGSDIVSTLMIAYNLAPGEALIFVGEE